MFEDIDAPLTKIFSPKFKGVEGILKNLAPWKRPYSVDVTTLASGIVYNTKKTSADQLPRTYAEFAEGKGFTDPKWKGNFAINSIGPASPLGDMAIQNYWDIEKQKKVLQAILANKPLIKRSSGDVRMAVALGEVAAATGNIGGRRLDRPDDSQGSEESKPGVALPRVCSRGRLAAGRADQRRRHVSRSAISACESTQIHAQGENIGVDS